MAFASFIVLLSCDLTHITRTYAPADKDDIFCSNIVDVSSYDELKVAISQGKWARGPWSARYVIFNYFKSLEDMYVKYVETYNLDLWHCNFNRKILKLLSLLP